MGDRRYRVRGLDKNESFDALKINLLAGREEAFHVDTLDLYAARQRTVFIRQAAIELGVKEDVVRRDLGHVLRKLEELQQEKTPEVKKPEVSMSGADHAAAMELLRAPDLPGRILADFERCGVVGEETNKLAGHIAAVSRHLEAPLGGDRAIVVGRGQEFADGRDSRVHAGRAPRAVFGDDGPRRCITWARPI